MNKNDLRLKELERELDEVKKLAEFHKKRGDALEKQLVAVRGDRDELIGKLCVGPEFEKAYAEIMEIYKKPKRKLVRTVRLKR